MLDLSLEDISSSSESATRASSFIPYDRSLHGRIWCVQIEHKDYVLVVRRALKRSFPNRGGAESDVARPLPPPRA